MEPKTQSGKHALGQAINNALMEVYDGLLEDAPE